MSHVLSAVLVTSIIEVEPGDAIFGEVSPFVVLNRKLREARSGGGWAFAKVDQHAGGGKAMQVHVWAGACNYLPPHLLREIVRSCPWQEPEAVVLIYEDEQDEKPTAVAGAGK